MARNPKGSGGDEVNDFMARLQHPLKAEIEAVRALLLSADPRIKEGIKWNAPSFYVQEHFCTFKLRPEESIQLVFHTGAKAKANVTAMDIADPADLLKWATADRCVAVFSDMEDIRSKQTALIAIVKQWIEQL